MVSALPMGALISKTTQHQQQLLQLLLEEEEPHFLVSSLFLLNENFK